MRIFTCLSNKKSVAPAVYISLHLGLLAFFVVYCPAIINFKQYPEALLFWLNVLVVITFYFNTHLRDPGYVPFDGIFYSEQDQQNFSKVRKRTDSLFSKRANLMRSQAKIGTPISNKNSETKDHMEFSKNFFKRTQDNNTTAANVLLVTNMATEMIHCPEKKVEDESPSVFSAGAGHQDVSSDEANKSGEHRNAKQELDMVVCEPSIDEGEESQPNENKMTFNSKSLENLDDYEIQEQKLSPKDEENIKTDPNLHDVSKQVNKEEYQEKEDQEIEAEYTKPKHIDLSSISQNQCKDHTYEGENSASVIIKDHSNNSQPLKSQSTKANKYYQFNDEESITVPGKLTSQTDFPSTEMVTSLQNQPDQNQEIDLTKFLVSNYKTTDRTFMTKLGFNRKKILNQKKDQNKEIILTGSKSADTSAITDLEQQKEETLYIERRYCTVCGIDQPIRAKHCKDCKRCIGQYDHHCPWLGTCVGEKNHLVFYWFLVFQLIEISWGEFKLFDYMFGKDYKNWGPDNVERIILAVFLSFFLLMVASLLCFHTYLAIVNLTTWETLSWYKISYLKEWHEDWGSPFSEGIIKNITYFCCKSKDELKRWKMPKHKRSVQKKESRNSQK